MAHPRSFRSGPALGYPPAELSTGDASIDRRVATTRIGGGSRRSAWSVLGLLALLGATACGSGSVPVPAPASPGSPPPFLTEVGTPTGAPVTGSIDPGSVTTLVSADGRLALSVPAGALPPSITTISVQEITNSALGGVGGAFRLGPEATTFSAPVTLVIRVPEAAAGSIDKLGIAYQDASGFWYRMPDVRRDAAAGTIAVETRHFSDWGLVWQEGVPGMYGTFTLTQTLGAIPFNAGGIGDALLPGERARRRRSTS